VTESGQDRTSDNFQQARKVLLSLFGIIFALAGLFFCYYTVRLLYVNLAVAEAAAHRSAGMYIGAVVFPLAVIVFGVLSWLCLRKVRRSGSKEK
jgi:predicted membrane protein